MNYRLHIVTMDGKKSYTVVFVNGNSSAPIPCKDLDNAERLMAELAIAGAGSLADLRIEI
jgi:hypothetical protein